MQTIEQSRVRKAGRTGEGRVEVRGRAGCMLHRTEWVCPMHPQVVRDAPGSCPICGMALEPRGAPGAEEGESPELRDMRRRLWFAAALSLPLVLLESGDLLTGGLVSRRPAMRCACAARLSEMGEETGNED